LSQDLVRGNWGEMCKHSKQANQTNKQKMKSQGQLRRV